MADTKIFKPKNKESGTLTQTLLAAEVATAYVSPVPENAPGVIVLRPGTVNEEHLYYKNRNSGAGTITGLTRDYTNLNGGTGFEHTNGASWETMQAAEYVKNIVDALFEGYLEEQETIAYVSGTQFTVKTDKTSLYTNGRVVRFNADNTKIANVTTSSYSAGTDLTTVTVTNGTVPSPLTKVETGIFPKSAADRLAVSLSVQSGSYVYAADSGGSDAYAITLSPAPSAYTTGMLIIFLANTANTGAATLNVNSLGAKTIKKYGTTDLATGDIRASSLNVVYYDGTNFQLLKSGEFNLATNQNIKVEDVNPWRTIDLAPGFLKPTTTSGCADSAKVEAGTNDVDYDVLDFDQTTQERAFCNFQMPDSWDAGVIQFRFIWTAAGGSAAQTFELELGGRSFANDDAIDQADGTFVGVSDALIATGDIHISDWSTDVTLAGTPAAGQWVHLVVRRDVANDNLAADARLIGVQVRFKQAKYSD